MKIIKAISQFAIATIIISLCLMTNVSAEQKIIEADGSYTIGDGLDENIYVAKERAKTEALRNASEGKERENRKATQT